VKQLARDGDEEVRHVVARRKDLPGELVERLAGDRSKGVREAIARRPDLHEEIALALAKDQDIRVALALAANPACPQKALEQLACHWNKEVVELVDHNPNVSPVD